MIPWDGWRGFPKEKINPTVRGHAQDAKRKGYQFFLCVEIQRIKQGRTQKSYWTKVSLLLARADQIVIIMY